MRRSSLVSLAAALAGLAGLTACGGGSRDVSEADTTSATGADTTVATTEAPASTAATMAASSAPASETTTTAAATTTAVPTSAAPSGSGDNAECLQGEWTLANLSLNAATVDYAMEGPVSGITLTFAPGSWTWTAADGRATGTWQGVPVELTVNGTAGGPMVAGSGQVQLSLDTSDGTAELSAAGLSESVPLEDVLAALAPSGTATLTCGPTDAALATTTVTMSLTRSPVPSGETPAPPATADPIVIDSPASPVTQACDGRPVQIISAASPITLTGDCPDVAISGSTNEVGIERAGVITVTGSFNEITWSVALSGSEPSVNDTGVGNQIGPD